MKLKQNVLKKIAAKLLPINGTITFIEERTPFLISTFSIKND